MTQLVRSVGDIVRGERGLLSIDEERWNP